MSNKILTNNPGGMPDDYLYSCDECGSQEEISIGCFGWCSIPKNDWVEHRGKDFCCQKCADTFEVKRPSMTRRITKNEYEEKYGKCDFKIANDITRQEFMKGMKS